MDFNEVGAGLQLDRDIHILDEIPFLRFLKKTLNLEDLMTYYHTKEKVWVVGYWLNKMEGRVRELHVISDLGLIGKSDVEEVKKALARWVNPTYLKNKAMNELKRARTNWERDATAANEIRQWGAKKGLSPSFG